MRNSLKHVIGVTSLLCLPIIFVSCEGGTTFTKVIANQSSDTIELKLYQSILQSKDVFTILPNEYKTVFVWDAERVFADDTYQCTSEIDSIRIHISGNKNLKKDIMQSTNWNWQRESGRNAQETCTFTITDSDFD